MALHEYRDTIDETERRRERLTEPRRQRAPGWRWAPVLAALQARRGGSFSTGVALVAELGDLTRVGHPRERMAYLVLVPSEHSSGPSVRRGGITTAGNPQVRRLLADCSPKPRGPTQGVRGLGACTRTDKPPCRTWWATSRGARNAVGRDASGASWRAARRSRRVATAIARELTGFIWAIAREVTPTASSRGDRQEVIGDRASRRHGGQVANP